MKVKLHYANLKVANGMTSKTLQEVEQVMVPYNPTSSFVYQKEDQIGEQEQAAAQAIMMLSCQRDKQTRLQAPHHTYLQTYPAQSDFPINHHHDPHYSYSDHYHHSHNRANLVNHPSLYYSSSRKKKEKKSDYHYKRVARQPLPPTSTTYTTPRRGRPKKAPTS